MEFTFPDFKPREYEKITFPFRIGGRTLVITVITASIATESLTTLLPMPDECGAVSAAICQMLSVEPTNFHTTERHPVDDTPRSSARYTSINTISANSFTGNYRQIFHVAGNGNDFKFTT